jgi:hypothetical protein
MGKMKELAIQKMNDAVCHGHESGVHVPDLTSITRDHKAPAGIVDINCVNCGRSGAVLITNEEVDW